VCWPQRTFLILLGVENALSDKEMSVLLCDTRSDPTRRQHYIRSGGGHIQAHDHPQQHGLGAHQHVQVTQQSLLVQQPNPSWLSSRGSRTATARSGSIMDTGKGTAMTRAPCPSWRGD
jgi:hypothetical protein